MHLHDFNLVALDNPEELDGLPCAVQIVAPRFHDEKCLAIAKVVGSILNQK
jgi:amidase